MKSYVISLIKGAIEQLKTQQLSLNLDGNFSNVIYPKTEFGDYATNVAMVLHKKLPDQSVVDVATLATMLAEKCQELDQEQVFSKITAVGGFINFTLLAPVLLKNLNIILNTQASYGQTDIGAGQKILVEYFQPNIAKPLHLGHLRTAIIGDAIFRILKFAGFAVESDTHLGDWGTQFGMVLLAYKKWGDKKIVEQDPIAELNNLYVQINLEIEQDPNLRELAKQEFLKLEQGDEENLRLWQQFKDWSWQEYAIIYDELGVRKSDYDWPESFFVDKMPAVVEMLKQNELLVESQGAQIVDLSEYNLGIAIIIKSDGATTYLLRDLATYIYRKQQGFAKQIYVVDNRQSQTLAQTFKILELLGVITGSDEALHIAYGVLTLPEGAMSTRKGTMIGAVDLISKAQEQALQIIEEKNPQLSNKSLVAKLIMQSAIKYFDLAHNYKSDIVFTWDKALSFEGNTGPYLQYTFARISGINRKSTSTFSLGNVTLPTAVSLNDLDMLVLRKLYKFPELIEQVALDISPNLLANYLFELSKDFNTFYESNPVNQAVDQELKLVRLAIAGATAQVLKNGLMLLGIEAPDEM